MSANQDLPSLQRQWTCGMQDTIEPMEVPGTVLLFPEFAKDSAILSEQQEIARNDEKITANGITLFPQPEETPNDPLNLPIWRRNAALLALGLYCMLGGGMAPLLATGFPNVAATYRVTIPQVALTTGLYMLGLGIGCVLFSPTAILFGKRPVYLATAGMFVGTSVWCAVSPNYKSLLLARIFQGIAISPVECLASSTVTELFFLHERAFRLGIYTLLLLSGKNLMPLVSAEIIQVSSWRAVFWVVAATGTLCLSLLVFLLPETFWDRSTSPSVANSISLQDYPQPSSDMKTSNDKVNVVLIEDTSPSLSSGTAQRKVNVNLSPESNISLDFDSTLNSKKSATVVEELEYITSTPPSGLASNSSLKKTSAYTAYWRLAPKKTYVQTISPYNGRLSYHNWFLVALRPFILFAYPSVLWGALIYSCSVGWLIVLSECISSVYRNKETYNFTALQSGLVYISAFIGGVLGTALAGKCSDWIVQAMARRNHGVYEPEFRLVMAVPVAVCSVAGLMGFGWSIEERDNWIVPTFFFGVISFGCSLGSTVAITFVVDCYREYAGEALVTLNFSKNILHGLVFSLFFPEWLEAKGSKSVFIAIGVIQLCALLFTIPMFIYGKRARAWTARKDMMRRFR